MKILNFDTMKYTIPIIDSQHKIKIPKAHAKSKDNFIVIC
jgi:hypothetical protein